MVKFVFSAEYASFRRILISERKAAGMTQQQVAEAINVPQSFLSKIETGERRLDVVEFIAIMRALGADPAEVLKKIEGACGI